jgi:hypothetical protein
MLKEVQMDTVLQREAVLARRMLALTEAELRSSSRATYSFASKEADHTLKVMDLLGP